MNSCLLDPCICGACPSRKSKKTRGLVEGNRIVEHKAHIHNGGRVPLVQGLVKAPGSGKHAPHRGHLRGVPGAHGLTDGRKRHVGIIPYPKYTGRNLVNPVYRIVFKKIYTILCL